MSDKEGNRNDRKYRQNETWNDGQKEQKDRCPKRDLRLRCRKFTAPATGAGFGVSRVYMHPVAELDVVASPAKIAEERLADSDAIAVVTIFHGNFYRRRWRWSWFGRNHI